MKLKKFSLISLMLLWCSFMLSCTTVPETGRKQLNFIPDSQLASAAQAQYGQMQKDVGISQNLEYQEIVQNIGKKIVEVARKESPEAKLPPPHQWQFTVFASEQVNAFAMPGGYVGFYEGIMDIFDNEDQLAAVMAHEVAHVVAKHGNERISQQVGLQLAMVGAAVGLSHTELENDLQSDIMVALGMGAQVGVLLPYSRAHESEADYLGLLYMTAAGYDPYQAVAFWKKMSQLNSHSVPEWLSTHPSNKTRIERLNSQIPEIKQKLGIY